MNRLKHLMIAALAVAMIGSHVVSLHAEPWDNLEGRHGDGMFFRLPGVRHFIAGLGLTPDQKDQIRSILADNKNLILQSTRDLVESRLGLVQGLPEAAMDFTEAQVQAITLKKQICEQIKPVLTPDQHSRVQKRQQLREQRFQNMLARLDNRIDR